MESYLWVGGGGGWWRTNRIRCCRGRRGTWRWRLDGCCEGYLTARFVIQEGLVVVVVDGEGGGVKGASKASP